MLAHNRLLFFSMGIITCMIAVGMSPAQAGNEPTGTAAESIGKVTELTGTAFAFNTKGEQRPLTLQSKIWMDEKIETSANASLTITFNDQTTISQGENGSMVIDEYVYTPEKKEDCSFGMRFMKGACRVVTGAITDSNPNRFKVKMRMATIGIRGCDLAFKTGASQDDAYVLDLGNLKSVQVTTTTDGSVLNDMAKNQDMGVDREKTKVLTLTESMQRVSVVQGKGYTQQNVTMEEVNDIAAEASEFAPAKYQVEQTGDSAIFTLEPQTK